MKHKGPDRLLRRRATEDKEEDQGIKEAKSWMDKIIECGI